MAFHHRPWTADTDRRLIVNYRAAELTVRQIAEGLGRPYGTVQARIYYLIAAGRLEPRGGPVDG